MLLIIRRQPGANILETIERVQGAAARRWRSRSRRPSTSTSRSTAAQTIRASVRDVELTLLISVCWWSLVVFVFLRSARATAIPSVAVPLSLVGTFGVMYLLDYSLDNLSLMALTISTGFVVDDAIVVTENVARFIEAGRARRSRRRSKGAKQIGFTIVSITVSLLAVFIPILLMGGIVGRLFREFAVTLSIAIAISALVSLTLTPMMCARLLRRDREREHGPARTASPSASSTACSRGYERALGWVLRHRALDAASSRSPPSRSPCCSTSSCRRASSRSRTPACSSGFSEAPQDISFAAMRERQEAVNAIVAQRSRRRPRRLVHRRRHGGDRQHRHDVRRAQAAARRARRTADEIIARLRPKLAQGRRASTCSCRRCRTCASAAALARTQYQYTLQDADLDELRDVGAARCSSALRKLPELQATWPPISRPPGLQLDVDHRSRHRVAPRHHAAGHRRHALRRLRPAAGRDHRTRSSTSTAWCWR